MAATAGKPGWMARPAPSLTELCARIAVVTFEPGSHDLIGGGRGSTAAATSTGGLFHVEPDFLPWWRRYARALKQRNAALKSGTIPAALAPGSASWPRRAK
jgi:DNA replication and repair protein RecF